MISPNVAIVMNVLRDFYTAIPLPDLKHRIRRYASDTTDEQIEEALEKLQREGLIEITEEQVGTMSEKLVSLTGKGISRSASAAF